MSNTVKSSNGSEIYTNDICLYADEYISTLKNKDLIYNAVGNCFTGMIKYINLNMHFNKSIYGDLVLLNNIWDIYVSLCYKYNQKPIVEEYCLLIGCSRASFYDWMNGNVRNEYCEKLGSTRSDVIKKWVDECKIGRYKSAAAGNVGGIFLCKAIDGLVETAPAHVEQAKKLQSMEEIQSQFLTDNKKKK